MRNNRLIILFISILLSLAMCLPLSAKKEKESEERIEELDEMDFIQMLNSVETGQASSLIQKFQAKEGKNRLINGKYNPDHTLCKVEAYRNKEVLVVTIPAHLLFDPNDTELKNGAGDYLAPIKRYLKEPDMFRVLLVMHTDNTGSEEYRDKITIERVNSVFDWFEESGANTKYLFSYALGDEMPLVPNNTMENRQQNRRLEIYLVPGTKMVEQAKKGRIAF